MNKCPISTGLLVNIQFYHLRVAKLVYQAEAKLKADKLKVFNPKVVKLYIYEQSC